MKAFARGLLVALVVGALAWLGLAWERPRWLPAWARLRLGPVRTWLERALLAPDEDDEREDREARARPAELIDDGWCDLQAERQKKAAGAQAEGAKSAAQTKGRDGSPAECRRLLPVIRLAAPEVARRIGLETAPVVSERHAHQLIANAETAYNAQHMAEVIPRVGGVLREVRVNLGQVVARGEVMAVVDSAQVGAAKASFLAMRAEVDLARVTYERTLKLTQAKAAPAKTELEQLTALTHAETNLRDAEQKLRNLGFNDADLERIASSKDTRNLLEITAPIDGTIITWDATMGEAVEPTTQLFALADTSGMWLWIDVYERDIVAVSPGEPVTFLISGTEEPIFSGKVTWMGTEVNTLTRTTRVRAELPNPEGRLRANQFGSATIRVGAPHDAIVVPRRAVQNADGAALVFVAQSDGSFRPQRVLTVPSVSDSLLEVTWGLKPGERVVTTRSYTLKAELFRDRLGAADND
ncbi:MAG TPA: efflux RND transporter periplasmic adaptor subunit [Isosphaeraceae bacterium]|nr:efflux RND transporter periplasmic adaptor subunit [Isosphaeraceae bacterium]